MKRYPFKFLNSYDSNDTDIFFGRDEEIEELYQMVFQTDILLVYGASGTGKTSLINCGLASRFQSHDWLALNIRRGQNINTSLAESLKNSIGEDLFSDWQMEAEEEDESQSSSDLTRQFQNIYQQYFRPIYLIFDQFEELHILGSKEEQRLFANTVKEILQLDQPVKMIFIIREEYLGHLYEFERAVPELLRKKLRIEPMTFDKVRQVIHGAASNPETIISLQSGEEEAIVEEIFQKIKGEKKALSIQLPYLQVFLDKLYMHLTKDKSRQAEVVFSTESLTQIGNIGDILRDFLEEQVLFIETLLSKKYPQLPENAIWQILSPFVTLDGTKEPRAFEEVSQQLTFPEAWIQDALQEMENTRIMRYDDSQELYEIAHDSLALRIMERRSEEEIALLEIRHLIRSQLLMQEQAREFFSEKQLNFMAPFLYKINLEEEEKSLIEASQEDLAQRKDAERQSLLKQRRRLISFLAILFFLLILLAKFWYDEEQQGDKLAEANESLQEKQYLLEIQQDSLQQQQEIVKGVFGASDEEWESLLIEWQNKDQEQVMKDIGSFDFGPVIRDLDLELQEYPLEKWKLLKQFDKLRIRLYVFSSRIEDLSGENLALVRSVGRVISQAAYSDYEVLVEAHTTLSGSNTTGPRALGLKISTNIFISSDRARVVADELVKSGVDLNKIMITGAGPNRPLVTKESNPDMRTSQRNNINRRLEIVLSPPKGLK